MTEDNEAILAQLAHRDEKQRAEITRLTAEVAQKDEIIHQLWHLFDDSEERTDMYGCVTINVEASRFALISELLSEEHPVDPRAEEIAQKEAEVARLREALADTSNGASGFCWCAHGSGYDGENCTDETCLSARAALEGKDA